MTRRSRALPAPALTCLVVALLAVTAACGSSGAKKGTAGAGVTASGTPAASASADPSASGSVSGSSSPGSSTGGASGPIPLVSANAAQRAVGVMSVPGKGTINAQPFTPAPITWSSTGCTSGYTCGSLIVPLDYANPGGATLAVALIRHVPAGASKGTVLVNFGGPGGAGVTLLPEFETSIASQITANFTMISFDPRGVGLTSPVKCQTDAQLDTLFHLDPEPTTQDGRTAYDNAARQLAAGCTSADTKGLLEHVGTEEVARDMNSLREALATPTISYIGYSYGTYLGEIWADLFPSTVRAMIIDGAIDPSIDLAKLVEVQGQGFDSVLQLFFDDCKNRSTCTWASGAGSPAAAFDALHAKVLAAGSIDAGNGRSLSLGEFNLGVGQAMYVKSYWKDLDNALADLTNGDAGALLDLSDQYVDRNSSGHYSNANEANIAVNCQDRTGPTTEQGWYDDASNTKATNGPRLGFAIVYNTLACTYMPATPRTPHTVSATGSAPILVIGTLNDPATPYVWAKAVSAQLQNNVLLTLNSAGHLASFQGSSCILNAENAYMVNLTLPAAGTTCQVG